MDGIEAALQAIVFEEIVGRFGRLTEDDVWNKADGDVVTEADMAAERRICALLQAVKPGSLVIGEEAVSEDPTLLAHADGPSVWIVDPLDSTMNFRAGDPDFSTLVAYCESGQVLRSWTFIPMRNTVLTATAGMGSLIDGRPVATARERSERPVVAVTHPAFRSPDDVSLFAALEPRSLRLVASRGAGIEYAALVSGEIDAVVFTWEKPWDHAAGALLVREAGGVHSDRLGARFRLGAGNALPLIAASGAELGSEIRGVVNFEIGRARPSPVDRSR